MDQSKLELDTDLAVGDQATLLEKKNSGVSEPVVVTIVEIRHILGKQTYVIDTGDGKRRVVGASQLMPLDK